MLNNDDDDDDDDADDDNDVDGDDDAVGHAGDDDAIDGDEDCCWRPGTGGYTEDGCYFGRCDTSRWDALLSSLPQRRIGETASSRFNIIVVLLSLF